MSHFDEIRKYIKERTGVDLKDADEKKVAATALEIWRTDYANLKHHQNRTMLRIHLHDFNQHVEWLVGIGERIEKLLPKVLEVEAKEKEEVVK